MRMLIISSVVAGTHFFEDLMLVVLGRYTEINLVLLMIGTVLFGLFLGGLARIPSIKRFLGK